MKRKHSAEEIKEMFKKNMRNLTQEELLDVIGYSFMRIVELEMLFQVLVKKKVIAPKDFESITPGFERKALARFKRLENRKRFF